MMMLVAFIVFMILLFMGVPIAFSMGLGSLLGLLVSGNPLSVVGQRLFSGINSFSLMAIPFFMLSGELMDKGGISRRLVNFANCIVGNVRGGMALALVLACAFFAALSGSAPATVIAIGSMLYPEMVRMGYPKDRTAGLLVVSGGLGPIIPPSIIMVVYATITGASIGDMFSSGMFIGILIMVVLMAVVLFLANKEKWPKTGEKLSMSDLWKSFVGAIPAILLPVIILGGIYSGLLTPTESAAVAVVWALIAGMFIYRELSIKDLVPIFLDSAKGSAMILFIIATSTAFSWIFAYSGISGELVHWIQGMHLSPMIFCIIIAVILLIFGTFLEGIATCVLMVPILWPIAASLGIDVIHFGMIVSLSNVIGTMTPPVAVNIFSAASVTKLKMGEIVKGQIPFFIGYILVFLAVVLIPAVSTFLLK